MVATEIMKEDGLLKFYKIPLFFLFVGSMMGLFLRWQFISPTQGINYSFLLHGHSHVMFLGWIFNVMYIAFTGNYIKESKQRFFRILFYVLQFLVVAMLISFPLQGYGFWSILFSTLHTIGAIVFSIKFFAETKNITSISLWYARTAMLFFLISTLGPFSLGYLMANGYQNQLNLFAIYFYLHFQYNGLFLFGVISMFLNLLERRQMSFDTNRMKLAGKILICTCVPAYLLSILWAKPGYMFNVIGGLAALVQFIPLAILIGMIVKNAKPMKSLICRSNRLFLLTALIAFGLKLALQLLSAFPYIAQLTIELRPVIIAYLHLVLVNLVSLVLLVLYSEHHVIGHHGRSILTIFFISAVGMEVCLVLTPWWHAIFGVNFSHAAVCTFSFSVTLAFSCLLFFLSSFKSLSDKSQ